MTTWGVPRQYFVFSDSLQSGGKQVLCSGDLVHFLCACHAMIKTQTTGHSAGCLDAHESEGQIQKKRNVTILGAVPIMPQLINLLFDQKKSITSFLCERRLCGRDEGNAAKGKIRRDRLRCQLRRCGGKKGGCRKIVVAK